jgi:glutathionylspermidine synthase
VARADVFFTDDGLQVTELNSDTPTGEPEAIVLGHVGRHDHPGFDDPCASLAPRLAGLWQTMHARFVDVDVASERTAAIIYPTEFTEDLSLIRLYQQLLQECGWKVVLGSPYNLGIGDDNRLDLFGEHPSLVVRHYKADWWSERQSVWIDDDVLDPAPLLGPLQALVRAQAARTAVVVNPLGCIASQSKRLMAFCWERIHRFSIPGQQTIKRLIPYTARLESVHEMQLRADQDRWVIKSDYGAEGDEVIIGRLTTPEVWQQTLAKARPGRFIAQQYFEARRDANGTVENHGVFVVGGEACGIYTRRDRGLTDATALSVPTLVRRDR